MPGSMLFVEEKRCVVRSAEQWIQKMMPFFFSFSWMGKIHNKWRKLGWEKVHRALHESDNVHDGDGCCGIVGKVKQNVHGGDFVQGRREAEGEHLGITKYPNFRHEVWVSPGTN